MPGGLEFLNSKYSRALTLALLAQIALYYSASHGEPVPLRRPLGAFPLDVRGWQMAEDNPVDKDTLDVLRTDDTLNRVYVTPAAASSVGLFVAYFKSQETGQWTHSPKHCLPGNGWEPVAAGYITVPVEGHTQPILVNRYVIARGENRSVVLYWYQSHNRVIASEYSAKFWLVADSIRYHRSDAALVRIVVPAVHNDLDAATQTGLSFVQAIFPVLRGYLPE